jgi:hypothetical protein
VAPARGGEVGIVFGNLPSTTDLYVTLSGPIRFDDGHQGISIPVDSADGSVRVALIPDAGAAGSAFQIEAHLLAGAQELWIDRTGTIVWQVQLPLILQQ